MSNIPTVAQVKARLSSDDVNMSDKWDGVLQDLINSVVATFDRTLGQQRGARGAYHMEATGTPSTRTYSRRGSRTSYLPIDDCVSVTSVTSANCPDLGTTGWTTDTAAGGPVVGLYRTLGPWPYGNGVISVVADWGMFASLPQDLHDQVIVEVARSYQSVRAGYDDKIGVTPFGSVQIAKAFADTTRRMIADYGYGGGFMRAGG